jgi:hypothetical protein
LSKTHNFRVFPGVTSYDIPSAVGDYAAVGGGDDGTFHLQGMMEWSGWGVSPPRSINSGTDIIKLAYQTDFSKAMDGLSNVVMVGEKHVRPDFFGDGDSTNAGDASIFNDDSSSWFARMLGRQPLGGGAFLDRFPAQSPSDSFRPAERFGSYHPGLCQFVFGDGSAKPIRNNTSIDILTRLALPRDGQPVPSF